MRKALRQEVEAVLERVEQVEDLAHPLMLTGVLAAAPHAAHHLGTIREMERQLKETHL